MYKSEILATQAREHITHYEATERVNERYIEQGKTYSWALTQTLRTDESNVSPITNQNNPETDFENNIHRLTGMSTNTTDALQTVTVKPQIHRTNETDATEINNNIKNKQNKENKRNKPISPHKGNKNCLLYTSDAADE